MSINVGSTKISGNYCGASPLLVATESDTRLIYPNWAVIGYGGSGGGGSYEESGDVTQWNLASGRLLFNNEAERYGLSAIVNDNFKSIICYASTPLNGIFKYKADIRNAINYSAIISIGIARYDGTKFVYMNGKNCTINSDWQTFDVEFGTTLIGGQIYAPVIKLGSTSIYERYACSTFLCD